MGEHKFPRDLAAKARDLRFDRAAVPAPDEWRPPFHATSCANCFWNWSDVPATGVANKMPACHLMPKQMMLASGDRLAGSLPGIVNPSEELCGGWKPRDQPPAGVPGGIELTGA